MAFKAELEVDGKKYKVFHSSYSMHQSTDNTGRVSSLVQGGTINVETESTKSTAMLQWMVMDDAKKDGKITFFSRTNEAQAMKTLNFKEAYLVSYTESFSSFGENPMTEQFTISAKEIKMDGEGSAEHKNEWPENT